VTDHVAIKVAALAGIDLQGGDTGCPDALGIVRGLLITLDHAYRQLAFEQLYGFDQQRRLAGTGAGNQIEGKNAPLVKSLTIRCGVGVVLGQDVLLDLHHPRLAQARHMRPGRAGAVVEIAGDAMFVVTVFVSVGMAMLMLATMDMRMGVFTAIGMMMRVGMPFGCSMIMAVGMVALCLMLMVVAVRMHRAILMDVGMLVRPRLDLDFPRTTTAYRTHKPISPDCYSISISLTRISVPPVG
jgi:hypothetical protein